MRNQPITDQKPLRMNTKKPVSLRNLHIKIGALVAVPLIISATTALIMAHNQELGLKHIPVNLSWLPDVRPFVRENVLSTVQSSLNARDGRYYVGTRYGLFVLNQGRLKRVDAIPGTDVRGIRETDQGVLVASKMGVWLHGNGVWKKIYQGETWEAQSAPDRSIQIMVKGKGLLVSRNEGKDWMPVIPVNNPLEKTPIAIDRANIPMDKLIFDIHTGNAFFGREWRWLWIDFVALPLLLLAISGLVLWVRSRKRQQHAYQKK